MLEVTLFSGVTKTVPGGRSWEEEEEGDLHPSGPARAGAGRAWCCHRTHSVCVHPQGCCTCKFTLAGRRVARTHTHAHACMGANVWLCSQPPCHQHFAGG